MKLNTKKILMLGGGVVGGVLLFNWWNKRRSAVPPASSVAKAVAAKVPKTSTKQTVINTIMAEPGVKNAVSELGQGAAGLIKDIFAKVSGGSEAPATPDQRA